MIISSRTPGWARLDKELLQRVPTCATKSGGAGCGSRQRAAPELITESCCRQDHTLWRDKGAARIARTSDRGMFAAGIPQA